MKKRIIILSVLAVVSISLMLSSTAFSVDLGEIPSVCLDPPCENPPGGYVRPTFDGLTVNGAVDISGNITDSNSDVTIADGLDVTGSLDVRGNLFDEIDSLTVADDLEISGFLNDYNSTSLSVNNNLKVFKATDRIGRFYYKDNFKTITPGTSDSAVVSCDTDDVRISCGSYYEAPDGYRYGTIPSAPAKCTLWGFNNSVINRTLRVYAYCFSPNG